MLPKIVNRFSLAVLDTTEVLLGNTLATAQS